ncbi:hypothetical protein L0Z37_30050 [Burkholderia multivorans]|nr:hypothetical protein [Burkholderia multivorans]MCO1368640.1 hypothetical protein [Burkholderia multivorans]MCO1380531.1 hypothetical protein [Burkholderia multivorans]MDN8032404.1 hypothetical protein [Burkholderia multivorans]UQP22042.1 hypothetical protein L0Y98_18015 [Burkholderia multivorans]UQP91510.1 hypothetical protein L0Y91_29255 [Burkholderia multivorans]
MKIAIAAIGPSLVIASFEMKPECDAHGRNECEAGDYRKRRAPSKTLRQH